MELLGLPAVVSLKRAEQLIEIYMGSLVKTISFEPKLARISVLMKDSTRFFVRYNDHDEYSYSVIFSSKELDRVRLDNHDDRWNVATRPHHFHPRMSLEGFSSPMIGKPDADIPLVSELINSKAFWRNDFRFS